MRFCLLYVLLFALFTTRGISLLARGDDYSTKGTLWLDSLTFNKIVPNANNAVLVMVSQKGEIGRLATDAIRDEFLFLAENSQEMVAKDSVLFAQVVVNGAQNYKLSMRIGTPASWRYPQVFLFPAGESTGIPFTMPGNKPEDGTLGASISDISRFVFKHTGLYLGTGDGTIQELDEFAGTFLSAATNKEKEVVLSQAEAHVAEKTSSKAYSPKELEASSWYVKIMRKILEKDESYVGAEINRLQSILESDKVSEARKHEFKLRIHIHRVFEKGAGEELFQKQEAAIAKAKAAQDNSKK